MWAMFMAPKAFSDFGGREGKSGLCRSVNWRWRPSHGIEPVFPHRRKQQAILVLSSIIFVEAG
jgi:hypothetical protein